MRSSWVRDLATLGLAIGGLGALATGVGLLGTVAGRTPPMLVVAFAAFAALAGLSAAVTILAGVRSEPTEAPPPDEPPPRRP